LVVHAAHGVGGGIGFGVGLVGAIVWQYVDHCTGGHSGMACSNYLTHTDEYAREAIEVGVIGSVIGFLAAYPFTKE
jgi:hypothetical protein